jgi:hypothetical protein
MHLIQCFFYANVNASGNYSQANVGVDLTSKLSVPLMFTK